MCRAGCFFILLFCFYSLYAQKPAEAGLVTENDLYTSPKNDKYYTNGLELFYRYLNNSSNVKLAKKITEFRLGQHIYNPQSVLADNFFVNDRPFAGYLFAEAGISKFYKSESLLKYTFQGGVVGPASGAADFQKLIHNTFGYHPVKGWQYQITNTPVIQAEIFYTQKVFKETFTEKIDVYLQGSVFAGMAFTGASVGPMVRISLKDVLLPIYNSALYNAAINSIKEQYRQQQELFIYLNPVLNYQLYDATIQGSLFNNTSPVTFPLIPFRFNAEAGIKYRKNNWNFSYSFNYRGKELSNNVITGYYYGSISISRFL